MVSYFWGGSAAQEQEQESWGVEQPATEADKYQVLAEQSFNFGE